MATMTILGQHINVDCSDGVSEHGVPYAERDLTVKQDRYALDINIRIYPKTTTLHVVYSPIVPSGEEEDDGEFSLGLHRVPTAKYKADAVVTIEQVIEMAAAHLNALTLSENDE